jgi:exodeoxyribonuclease VII large subunit
MESAHATTEGANPDTKPANAGDRRLPGPFSVGRWAAGFRDFLRARPRVQLIGEVTGFRRARANAYFELRDSHGAVPCSIWTSRLDALALPEGSLRDGTEVVVAGGPDFYPGTATASPGFSFRVDHLRLAGEGDLLARLAALRRLLEGDGLFAPQKALARPALPRTIGVVTARRSAACADLLAGLARRGWGGTIVWADAPVQDRHAAGAIAAALRDLAAVPSVEVAVVCRGGGGIADLWALCDEGLCRTVALLRIPVISAIGHESDRALLDDVAAVSCSTPTHAAEALVEVDVSDARSQLCSRAAVAERAGAAAIASRVRRLAELARGPQRAVRGERARLHQRLREVRASATRGVAERRTLAATHGLVVARKGGAFAGAETSARAQLVRSARVIETRARAAASRPGDQITALARTLRAHEPERTLERGYALVSDSAGNPIPVATAARERERLVVRFVDDSVPVHVTREAHDRGT